MTGYPTKYCAQCKTKLTKKTTYYSTKSYSFCSENCLKKYRTRMNNKSKEAYERLRKDPVRWAKLLEWHRKRSNIPEIKEYHKKYYREHSEALRKHNKKRYEKIKNDPEFRAYVIEYREKNKDKITELSRKYYKENRDSILAVRAVWYKNNPEKVKDYYKKNKEKILVRCREWRKNNPEKVKEIGRAYYWKNIEKMREKSRKDARKYYQAHKEKCKEASKRRYEQIKNDPTRPKCRVKECNNKTYCSGRCEKHYHLYLKKKGGQI
jgi:hypothetical protein